MCDPIRTLAIAQRLRRDAAQTRQLAFSAMMLRTAEELEDLVRSQDIQFPAPSDRRTAAVHGH